ncbi:PREDICTED: probable beta-D-xylosidase 2 [Tarenaya hassleriana]|uniref:probable beta-D-xylosidase 2 n=1 Tax=Tarenaya hassleriana TaxID=28532 RepID=UPI00053C2799|nr:PREDICTED: probable beta-D-xylosidase 2 [Tarenaya hassleriana]
MGQLILSLLLLLSFAVSSSAVILGDVPLNYTHVCDPVRFRNIGLDMSEFSYCDKSLPFDVRVKDLVARMKLSEKVEQMGDNATGVMRIGLPAYEWWSEALHGVSDTGGGSTFGGAVPGATSFPLVINSAASFNRTLWKKIGQVISSEARAMHNVGQGGLTFWSPNINVVRDPRWGRILETPGEDPYVVGTYASNFVRGLQDIEGTGNTTDLNFRPLKVSACCKHYTAYDIDRWPGVDRYSFDARVTEQDMMETFQMPFEMCVKEGDASSVMCSFNRVNGIPTCADHRLLKHTIRRDWNLHGYIVADCDSVDAMVKAHKWLGDTFEDAASQSLKAGLDLDCGGSYRMALQNAVYQGQISESLVDESLKNLYVVLMRLGFFDGRPEFASLTKSDVCSESNMKFAEEAAKEGMVLLKNNDDVLPLSSDKYKNLAVVGPHANATIAMIGNYHGVPCRYISPIQGFSEFANVTFSAGCGDVLCKNRTLVFPAAQTARNADATVIVAGLDLTAEAEDLDRLDLNLPGYQKELIVQVAEMAKGPVILVVMSGGGVDITFAKNHPNITAILWAGYPGQEGGRAIADVIFGHYNPGGRLPLTWYEADYAQQLPMTYMKLRPDNEQGFPGKTYKFYNGTGVFPFGYGLSYTDFKYEISRSDQIIPVHVKISKNQLCRHVNYTDPGEEPTEGCMAVVVDDLPCKETVAVKVSVENIGKRDGSEVIMAYSKPPRGIHGTHRKQVVGFERVFVPTGKSEDVRFEFDVCRSFSIVDAVGYRILPSGNHGVLIGDGERRIPVQVKISFHH